MRAKRTLNVLAWVGVILARFCAGLGAPTAVGRGALVAPRAPAAIVPLGLAPRTWGFRPIIPFFINIFAIYFVRIIFFNSVFNLRSGGGDYYLT